MVCVCVCVGRRWAVDLEVCLGILYTNTPFQHQKQIIASIFYFVLKLLPLHTYLTAIWKNK